MLAAYCAVNPSDIYNDLVKIESEVRKLDPAFFGTDLQRRSALFS
jgi:hypothetical protein